jgi:hypothetical protein
VAGWNNGTITGSHSAGTITGGSQVGGIVGYNNGGSVIDSHSTGNVTGEGAIGGIAGQNEGLISECSASGEVTGTGYMVGGIVGRQSVATSRIENCEALNPSVSGVDVDYVGRIVGMLDGGTLSGNFALATMTVNGSTINISDTDYGDDQRHGGNLP